MDTDLNGRVAAVTGASRGIGLAIVQALAASGARVVAGAQKSSAELDELACDGLVRFAEVNLADARGPARLIAETGSTS